jgi:hypothetical protein
MRYTIEADSIAGNMLIGIYDTLSEAQHAAASHRCHIRPIFFAPLANIITAAKLDDLTALLDNAAKVG